MAYDKISTKNLRIRYLRLKDAEYNLTLELAVTKNEVEAFLAELERRAVAGGFDWRTQEESEQDLLDRASSHGYPPEEVEADIAQAIAEARSEQGGEK